MTFEDGGDLPVPSASGLVCPYDLMPFQEIGVDYVVSREYSLLADDMGL